MKHVKSMFLLILFLTMVSTGYADSEHDYWTLRIINHTDVDIQLQAYDGVGIWIAKNNTTPSSLPYNALPIGQTKDYWVTVPAQETKQWNFVTDTGDVTRALYLSVQYTKESNGTAPTHLINSNILLPAGHTPPSISGWADPNSQLTDPLSKSKNCQVVQSLATTYPKTLSITYTALNRKGKTCKLAE